MALCLAAAPSLRGMAADAVPARSMDALIADLASPDQAIQEKAEEALKKCGPEAVTALVNALEADDPELRIGAAYVLGTVGKDAYDAAAALLTALVRTDTWRVRLHGAIALGRVTAGRKDAVPLLVEMLGDPRRALRQAAVQGLMGVGEPAAPAVVQAMETKEEPRRTWAVIAIRGLAEHAPFAAPLLGRLMHEGDYELWRSAAYAVSEMRDRGQAAVEHLIPLIEDPDPDVRDMALVVLEQIGAQDDPRVVQALMAAFKNPNETVRNEAIVQLRLAGHAAKEAVADLVELVRGDDPAARRAAAMALAWIDPAAADLEEPLRMALRSEEGDVRRQAAEGVARLGERAGPLVSDLVAMLEHEHHGARQAAADALGHLGPVADKAAEPLIGLFADEDGWTRGTAMWAAVEVGATRDQLEPVLRPMLADDNPAKQAKAARTLQRAGVPSAEMLPVVKPLVGHEDWQVWLPALEVVICAGTEAADLAPTLQPLKRRAEGWRRMFLRTACAAVRPESDPDCVPDLVRNLRHKRFWMRRDSAHLLGLLGVQAREAVPPLEKMIEAEKHPEVKRVAQDALESIHEACGDEEGDA